jgi:hypothetical protein
MIAVGPLWHLPWPREEPEAHKGRQHHQRWSPATKEKVLSASVVHIFDRVEQDLGKRPTVWRITPRQPDHGQCNSQDGERQEPEKASRRHVARMPAWAQATVGLVRVSASQRIERSIILAVLWHGDGTGAAQPITGHGTGRVLDPA